MKAVILAGGLGTRISEETHVKPKPMIEIGGKPILWHIMKIYSCHGINDFIVCCGYKAYVIKEYFANYFLHMSDVTFDMAHLGSPLNRTCGKNTVKGEPTRAGVCDPGLLLGIKHDSQPVRMRKFRQKLRQLRLSGEPSPCKVSRRGRLGFDEQLDG
jgi:glucose-1-phosphate cytidylyltransferase